MDEKILNGQDIAFRMGEILLENGAEISRVQETTEKVALALGVENFDLFVLTNAIFASGTHKGINSRTRIKFVPSTSIHFEKIVQINQLSRDIVNRKVDVEEAKIRLVEIENIKFSALWKRVLACSIGSACFCYLFGGDFVDSMVACVCGIFIELFLHYADKYKFSKFITNILGSSIVTILSLIMVSFGFGHQLSKIIIGSIIRLVPGMAMTTSIRDFFNSDYLSGTIRMIDALIIGGSIAIGVGAVISVANLFLGGLSL